MTDQSRPDEPRLPLRRNVLIDNDYGFIGRWVAVPREDFDALRAEARSAGAAPLVAMADPDCDFCNPTEAAERSAGAASLDVLIRQTHRDISNAADPPEGECECGLDMESHAGGFALLNHDLYLVDAIAVRLAERTDR